MTSIQVIIVAAGWWRPYNWKRDPGDLATQCPGVAKVHLALGGVERVLRRNDGGIRPHRHVSVHDSVILQRKVNIQSTA